MSGQAQQFQPPPVYEDEWEDLPATAYKPAKTNGSDETRDVQLSDHLDMAHSHNGKFTLQDGSEFHGFSFGAERSVAGEVVFNTGMVGYPESLTDPSYKGQILVLTFPSIGNYGVAPDTIGPLGLPKYFESSQIQISALIIADYSHEPSHWTQTRSLSRWLKDHNIPALYGLDTRALTKKIRDRGAMLGKIEFGSDKIDFSDPNTRNLVAEVSRKKPEVYGEGKIKIIALDCGIKNNIIRYLVSKGIQLKVVPWDYDFNQEDWDGLFLSNGPGDPMQCTKAIEHIRVAMQGDKPVFGICMGNQLLALAAGAQTYKMKFGNRGMNQPCIDLRTTLCYITPQNHGYAVDTATLPPDWKPFFLNANDNSNEGIIHSYKPFFSVQFHPEAMGGPTDTEFLFDMFLHRVRDKRTIISTVVLPPPQPPIRKVLLLGSGGLSIGQAGEFDYSGSQAIKALKEEQVYVVLVNPNIATVQTSLGMADRIYFLPVTPEFVAQVIEKERPDGILLQFGGQTALNCGLQLDEQGILKKYNCVVLGTPVETIKATEDREIFAAKLAEIKESVAPSKVVETVEDAMKAAEEVGYPVLVRSGFALGGLGSGFAEDANTLLPLVQKAFAGSSQIIIDKSLRGWKEVEYEVVRDCKGNCITVCNMENFDPLGIHTGDSIVIAPSQTLSNREYYKLRSVAIKVVRHLGVVGECNIQYALDPKSHKYCIIEVNARLSRSSALASKATGYPLAYVAAKLAMGIPLTDIKNSVTKTTTACFEPSLDYLVCKVPRWDLRKFSHVSSTIGSAMKSVGEVMAIGRTFEECFQKALRMVDDSLDGFGDLGSVNESLMTCSSEELNYELVNPSDRRVYAIAAALKRGYSVDRIHELTFIDKWFLCKLRHIIEIETVLHKLRKGEKHVSGVQTLCELASPPQEVSGMIGREDVFPKPWHPSDEERKQGEEREEKDESSSDLPQFVPQQLNRRRVTSSADLRSLARMDAQKRKGNGNGQADALYRMTQSMMRSAKCYGFSDRQIGRCLGAPELVVREYRKRLGILPWVKQIDTLAAEFPSVTNYLYMTYSGSEHDVTFQDKGVMVLGCGAYRIGSSVEFDWCAVSCMRTLRKQGYKGIMVNYNPETVSTDYDECDRLYFEELSLERVLDISEAEDSAGVVVSVGGQIPNNLSGPLHAQGVRVLGTSPDAIDCCEDRSKFSRLLDKLDIDQPPWKALTTLREAKQFAESVEYPVLVRPSYVLSGAAMNVASTPQELDTYLQQAATLSSDYPVVISKFILGAKEIEYDGVAKNGTVLNYAISEHVENAGVHSGDATLVLPAQKLYVETVKRIKKIAARIAMALRISGPFNIQLLSKNNDIKVIECNLRASRSLPFVSKTFNVNFIELATKVMIGSPTRASTIDLTDVDHVCMKVPMFSFTRLQGADPVLRVEMASTGEVACFGETMYDSFLLGLMSTGFKLPYRSILVTAGPLHSKVEFLPAAQLLQRMGFTLYGTPGTVDFFAQHGVKMQILHKPSYVDKSPQILDYLKNKKIDLVINIPHSSDPSELTDGYKIRRTAVDFSIPLITNIKTASLFAEALERVRQPGFHWPIKSWDEYMREAKLL